MCVCLQLFNFIKFSSSEVFRFLQLLKWCLGAELLVMMIRIKGVCQIHSVLGLIAKLNNNSIYIFPTEKHHVVCFKRFASLKLF